MDGDPPCWSRRAVLGVLGTGAAGLAGCLTAEDTPAGTPRTGNDTKTQTEQTPRPSPTPKSTPDGPTSIEVPAAPGDCPGYGNAEPVVCYDAVAGQEAAFPAYLEPSAASFSPGTPVSFTLHNTSERALNTNFYNWRVHKQVDGEWYSVAPRFVNQPLMRVPPGGDHTWTLTVDNSGVESGKPVRGVSATEDIEIAGLGGGHYALRARGWFDTADHEHAAVFAATVDLDAPTLRLTPTDAIQGTEQDGQTLIAESDRGNPDDEDFRRGAFVVDALDDAEPDRRLITEQLLRRPRLRDTVALALDREVTTVRLVEYDGTYPLFGVREPYSFAYQDETFRVSTEDLAE